MGKHWGKELSGELVSLPGSVTSWGRDEGTATPRLY